MQKKQPYYMAYPMPHLYGEDHIERRDMEYLKGLYPEAVKKVLFFVEEECDRLEYDGSMIFDEYPDQLQLQMIGGRVCRQVKETDRHHQCPKDDHLKDIVQILLYQELMRRRCDQRKCRRRYY